MWDEQSWERGAVRSATKTSVGKARSLSPTTTYCAFSSYRHGHGSSRRFEGILPFPLSSSHLRAHLLSKARKQDPDQDTYEMNPPTNLDNQNLSEASDNFYDEVPRSTSLHLSNFTQAQLTNDTST